MICLLILIIIFGCIFLIISYFYSSVFARTDINENFAVNFSEERYIYGSDGIKLYAGFDILENSRRFAVLYYGYGSNSELLNKLKEFYLESGYSVIQVCASSFCKSEGKKKCSDFKLKSELELWLHCISHMFGDNISIILHGFDYTALSCMILNMSDFPCIKCLVIHNACICPVYLYKHIKSKFILSILSKKSQINIPVINIPVFIIADFELKKDAYKACSLCSDVRDLYIFKNYNSDQYLSRLNKFITHLKPPEVST